MSNYLEENGYYAYLDAAGKTLRPCPLCDGKAIYRSGIHNGYDFESGTIRCVGCGLKLGVTLYGYGNYDPLHAFDAWNTRAERTCGEPRGFTPHDQDNFGHPSFTELWCEHCDIELDPEWDYCPNCGAKVVGS